MKKIEISNIPCDLLNCISGGDIGLTPGIFGNENVIVGKFQIDYPITDNIAVTATTTVVSNYDDILNPINSIGLVVKF